MGWIRSPRALVALLIISVLINGALAGALAQRQFAEPAAAPRAETRAMMRGPFNPRAFIAALPEDERAAARETLRGNMPAMRERFTEARDARREAETVLRADPFDPTAAAAALSEARAARARIEAEGEAVILNIIAGLDAETRQTVLNEAYSGQRQRRTRDGRRQPD